LVEKEQYNIVKTERAFAGEVSRFISMFGDKITIRQSSIYSVISGFK